jgi:hypothetical protein
MFWWSGEEDSLNIFKNRMVSAARAKSRSVQAGLDFGDTTTIPLPSLVNTVSRLTVTVSEASGQVFRSVRVQEDILLRI